MSSRVFARMAAAALGFAAVALFALNWPARDAAALPPERKPWTTSKVVGSPDPPPKYKSARAFPDAKFNHPLLIARCPGSDRLFVGEQEGMLYSLADKPDAKP